MPYHAVLAGVKTKSEVKYKIHLSGGEELKALVMRLARTFSLPSLFF